MRPAARPSVVGRCESRGEHAEPLRVRGALDVEAELPASQRWSDSAPRCFATTSQAAASASRRSSHCASIACSSCLPTRIGGFDQIAPNRRSAGTSPGSAALMFVMPCRAALRRTRSRARSFTSTAHTVASGDCKARLRAIGPQPAPRSSSCPIGGGGGTESSRMRVPSSRCSGLKTPPAVTRSRSRPASRARTVRVLKSLRGEEEK